MWPARESGENRINFVKIKSFIFSFFLLLIITPSRVHGVCEHGVDLLRVRLMVDFVSQRGPVLVQPVPLRRRQINPHRVRDVNGEFVDIPPVN